MLEIKNLFKEKEKLLVNHINLSVSAGKLVSLECGVDVSHLLIDLLIGKELPAKGSIHLDDHSIVQGTRDELKNLGVVLANEGFYERLTVEGYLKFFHEIFNSKTNYREIMMKLALLDIGSTKIAALTAPQRKRLSFARERLKDLKLFIFQEPLFNIDKDVTRVIIDNIEELRAQGVAVLTTSVSVKDCILLGGEVYTLDEYGITAFSHDGEPDLSTDKSSLKQSPEEDLAPASAEDKPILKVEKIPAKIDERMILFNPMEIDFVESDQGVSTLNVRGEKFTCTLSLNELEERLDSFGFFRSHRSYIVNLQRVREIVTWTRNSYSLVLDDKPKSSIPLSKGRLDELKQILILK
ncbi:LytTR family transcriptional regulator DNA-binding domain-containing protein [Dethiobacter alkaliphilus]|uniref:LytTR family transcriptional regulator DNA-binding domain-containing protein n=1 Tax=Dethiobacter alkaliphilus TaxID=427926 RepID=UPI0022268622|nr:LytTR family transcriptional regulator DNA-binding domain-containing protein [Dethiobacter alkaliphilus]MCW3489487.1 LytTR family transcriptional regulator DNA-binding domain-containing protein [Dethiobacter alkaliphilus]